MENTKIYPNVSIGEGAVIGDFVVIGTPPQGRGEGELATVIGSHAVIRSHTVIYAGNVIGDHFQTGHHVLIRESNSIGSKVSIGTNSVIEHHVAIADGVRIHSNAFIPEYSTLKEGCWIGPNVVLTNASYPNSRDAKSHLKGPIIERGAKIGANATVLPGITVGENCLIGAGSVVTKDIEKGHVVVGNPARSINNINNLPY